MCVRCDQEENDVVSANIRPDAPPPTGRPLHLASDTATHGEASCCIFCAKCIRGTGAKPLTEILVACEVLMKSQAYCEAISSSRDSRWKVRCPRLAWRELPSALHMAFGRLGLDRASLPQVREAVSKELPRHGTVISPNRRHPYFV